MSRIPTSFRSDAPFDVVGLGQNSVDHLCVVPGFPTFAGKVPILQHDLQGGGQIATAMVACQRLGLKTKYVGKIGDDTFGQLSRDSVAQEGVDVSAVRTVPSAQTQFAFIIVDKPSGERTVLWGFDPKLTLDPTEIDPDDVCSSRVLHVDVTGVPAAIRAAEMARARGSRVCIDVDRVAPGVEDLLQQCDVVIASQNFPRDLAGSNNPTDGLRVLRQHTKGFVCITLGDHGAVALVGDELVHSPAFAVNVEDTTGCGDVFHGAFIFAMLQRWNEATCLRYANAAAALKCRRLGGRPGIPTYTEVERFLASNPPTRRAQ